MKQSHELEKKLHSVSVRTVVWKVNEFNLNIASVRLRTILPAIELSRRGFNVYIADTKIANEKILKADLIIINKSFTEEDVKLASESKKLGKKLIFDLCDNIFIDNYAGGNEEILKNFHLISELADLIVVPTGELAKLIKRRFPGKTVKIVGDAYDDYSVDKIYSCLLFRQNKYCKKLINPGIINISSLLLRENSMSNRLYSSFYYNINLISYISRYIVNLQKYKRLEKTRKTIVWFGNSGGKYGKWGIENIFDLIGAINEVNKQMPVQLLIISGEYKLIPDIRRKADFPVCFRKWNTLISKKIIAESDVCLIPSSLDGFSITKSSNRAVLALSLGVPVLASAVPSMKDFNDAVILDNWQEGLKQYLNDYSLVMKHLDVGRKIIDDHYSINTITDSWQRIMSELTVKSI